jgi:maltooligosyltrehalose trehalohydrolase
MRLAASSRAASAAVQEARLGANLLADGRWQFLLWAPQSGSVSIRFSRSNRVIAMESLEHGYHRAIVDELGAGERYLYRLEDGRELPDPASRFQP